MREPSGIEWRQAIGTALGIPLGTRLPTLEEACGLIEPLVGEGGVLQLALQIQKRVWTIETPGRHIIHHGLGTGDYMYEVWGQDDDGRRVIYEAVENKGQNEIIVNVTSSLVVFPIQLVVCW